MKAILGIMILTFGLNAGAEKRGGGHDIESGFKAMVVEEAQQQSLLPQQYRSKLKFNPHIALATAYAVEPKCAVEAEMKVLQDKGKLAYFNGGTTILLDCTGYSGELEKRNPSVKLNQEQRKQKIRELWIEIFKRKSMKDRVLALHEVLRVGKVEGEDSYSGSGSIAAVNLLQRQDEAKMILRMLNASDNVGCRLQIMDTPPHRVVFVTSYQGASYASEPLSLSRSAVATELMNPASKDEQIEQILNLLRVNNCFEDPNKEENEKKIARAEGVRRLLSGNGKCHITAKDDVMWISSSEGKSFGPDWSFIFHYTLGSAPQVLNDMVSPSPTMEVSKQAVSVLVNHKCFEY